MKWPRVKKGDLFPLIVTVVFVVLSVYLVARIVMMKD